MSLEGPHECGHYERRSRRCRSGRSQHAVERCRFTRNEAEVNDAALRPRGNADRLAVAECVPEPTRPSDQCAGRIADVGLSSHQQNAMNHRVLACPQIKRDPTSGLNGRRGFEPAGRTGHSQAFDLRPSGWQWRQHRAFSNDRQSGGDQRSLIAQQLHRDRMRHQGLPQPGTSREADQQHRRNRDPPRAAMQLVITADTSYRALQGLRQ